MQWTLSIFLSLWWTELTLKVTFVYFMSYTYEVYVLVFTLIKYYFNQTSPSFWLLVNSLDVQVCSLSSTIIVTLLVARPHCILSNIKLFALNQQSYAKKKVEQYKTIIIFRHLPILMNVNMRCFWMKETLNSLSSKLQIVSHLENLPQNVPDSWKCDKTFTV